MTPETIHASQITLLQRAIELNELYEKIAELETLLDDPSSTWNMRQSEFMAALSIARTRLQETRDAEAREIKRLELERQKSQPILQTVHDLIISGANGDELSLFIERNQTYGVGWWLDIPSPLHLDLSTNPISILVASAFRAIRLTRFESHLRNKKSRLSQFRMLKKFPAESGILTFLETSENKSLALRYVLTRADAERSVAFMLALPTHPGRLTNPINPTDPTAKEKSDDANTFR